MSDRHGKEIPARDCIINVECGGGAIMSMVNPYSDDNCEWSLRYGNVERMRFCAASVISSYDYLLSSNISMKEAVRRLRLMRCARIAARDKKLSES